MRNKLISLVMITIMVISITGCGDTKVIENIKYDTYDLLNSDDKKNPNIQYEVIWGNVIWGTLLFETVIAPIYFFGFSLFEPIGKKPKIKGAIIH